MGVEVRIHGVFAGNAEVARDFDGMMRDRAPCLLAVARRLLRDESEARELVELAMTAARDLLPEFRASSPGDWLQGLVVGLAVARTERRRTPERKGPKRRTPSRSPRDDR